MTDVAVDTSVALTETSPRRSGLRSRWRRIAAFLISSLAGLIIGGIIILATGHNPIDAYRALVDGAFFGPNYVNLVSTINRSIPIVGMGLAAAIAFRAGFFNLGGEGQLVLGGLAAALAALYLPIPSPFLMPVAILCGALAGGLYAAFAAFLQFQLAVPLLISTLILNYPARYFVTYLVDHPFRDVASGMAETHMVPSAALIPTLSAGTQLHYGLFILIAILLGMAFLIRRTTLGYEMNIAGINPRFARYGGISIQRLGYIAMFSSGAIAGVVGSIAVLADFTRYIDGALTDPLYTWTGLMAALLANSAPFGVAGVGFFFSALETGAFGMEQATSVPRELAQILQSVIILLIVARTNIRTGTRGSGRGSS